MRSEFQEQQYTDERGYEHLLVAGPDRNASLVVVQTGTGDDVIVTGVLTVHHREQQFENTGPAECPDFGGTCYPANHYRDGHELAAYVAAGHGDLAFSFMRGRCQDD